jgi:hypothetical protein
MTGEFFAGGVMEAGFRRNVLWWLGAASLLLGPALALADDSRRLLKLAAGEETTAWGTTVKAREPSVLLLSLSSELATIAVLDGKVVHGGKAAGPGEAFVTTIESRKTQRLQFDARRLTATLPPEWRDDAGVPLDAIAARQSRLRYWGLIEPSKLNASAPVAPAMEAVRSSYLNNDAIALLRREAAGDLQTLAVLTAKRFAAALAARDAATVSALIDPKPFTDTGASAEKWQSARNAFAAKLTGDAALTSAMATEPAVAADDQTAFDAGSYRIRLVPRDRAMFVAAVEAK